MRGLLNTVPLTVLLAVVVVLSIAVMVGLVAIVRRVIPSTKDGFHAEISAPMLGVVAALFGLLLAFVIVVAYENYLDADANASREADALASIVRDSEAFPEPAGEEVRRAVGIYARAVADVEWEEMREGKDSDQARSGLDDVFAAFRKVEPKTPSATAFYDDAVRQLNEALEARRDRIQSAKGGLARDITILIVFGSLVIIVYAVLVGSPSFWFHAIGPIAIASVVVFSLLVLADLSYPFSGDVRVEPDEFRSGVLSQYFPSP